MSKYATIEGFEQLTKQQMFDMSVEHISKTRKKSVKEGEWGSSTCSYSGIGCAAAPFIRPELRESAEGNSWHVLSRDGRVPLHNSDLVQELQDCHDAARTEYFMRDWKYGMKQLAVRENLSTEKLDRVLD